MARDWMCRDATPPTGAPVLPIEWPAFRQVIVTTEVPRAASKSDG
jgi:hypothetical protein